MICVFNVFLSFGGFWILHDQPPKCLRGLFGKSLKVSNWSSGTDHGILDGTFRPSLIENDTRREKARFVPAVEPCQVTMIIMSSCG
jgi:hypothetical protein